MQMSQARKKKGFAKGKAGEEDEDEFERMLDEPRTFTKNRALPGIPGGSVQYTRSVLYHQEEDDFDASRHQLPLQEHGDEGGGGQLPTLPDVYEDARYADMDEQPEAIAQYREFIWSKDWRQKISSKRELATTRAAQVRGEARAQEAQRRKTLMRAMARAKDVQEDLLSGNFLRNIPPEMVPTFMGEATPVLGVLLPRLYQRKSDVVHETLQSLVDAMLAAGCTHRDTKLHVLRGPLSAHLRTRRELDAYEPFQGPPEGTLEALHHAHFDGEQNETRVVEVTFSCIFSGDDDGEEEAEDDGDGDGVAEGGGEDGMERAVHLQLDGADADEGQREDGAGTWQRKRADEEGKERGGEPEDEFRYCVHVVCHEVAPGEQTLCFRTFYFSR